MRSYMCIYIQYVVNDTGIMSPSMLKLYLISFTIANIMKPML